MCWPDLMLAAVLDPRPKRRSNRPRSARSSSRAVAAQRRNQVAAHRLRADEFERDANEIGATRVPSGLDADVVGLDVAMDHLRCMRGPESLCRSCGEDEGILDAQPPLFFEQVPERPPLQNSMIM